MGKHLYEITKAFQEVGEILEKLSPEDLEKATEFMNDLQIAMEDKVRNIAIMLNSWDGTIDQIDAEIKRLGQMKKFYQRKQKYLKDYLLFNMESLKIDKVETGIFTAKLKKNPAKIEAVDESIISDDYKKEKITYTVDKAKAKKEYNDTGVLPAGFIITDSKRVEIK